MSVTIYSVVMSLIWFTLASLVGCYILRQETGKSSLAFAGMVFLMAGLRAFAPIEFPKVMIIHSSYIYPKIQDCMRYPIAGIVPVGKCLMLIWITGAALRFIWMVQNLVRQRNFQKKVELQKVDEWPGSLFDEVAKDFGYHGPFRLVVAPNTSSAYQAGYFRPCILLPAQVDLFTDADVRNMFRHELCHFLSGDLWIKTGLEIMSCAFWWNPIMPMVRESVEQLLELRCDQKVCKRLPEDMRLAYMETLMKLVKSGSSEHTQIYVNYLGNENDENIIQRFQALLWDKPRSSTKIRTAICLFLCLVVFIGSYFFIVQPCAYPDIDDIGGDGQVHWMNIETDYIVRKMDGTLLYYCNGEYFGPIMEKSLYTEPFNEMQLIYEGDVN